MKKIFTFLFLATTFSSFAQYDANRYRESVFPSADAQTDVKYASSPVWTIPYNKKDLKLNVYQPTGDTHNKRPLIIFAHAGGFLNGSKDVDNMVAICDSFARKGYVTATIDYRKGFNPLSEGSAERAVYRGIQDGKAAVRYFKEYALTYGIDTNNIFFGGMSAGGFISLHVGYMDKESERPQSTYGGGTVNDLKCLDCAGNSYSHSSKVKGILDYWGAVSDTSIIEAGDIPLMIMHGASDPTVPYVHGYPFGVPTLPKTYGGKPVSERAINLGMDVEFYTSNGPLHMLDGSDNGTFNNPPNDFWHDTLIPRTKDFLLRLIKPETVKISPDTLYVCGNEVTDFMVSNDPLSHYVWFYNNAQTVLDNNGSTLKLKYTNAGVYSVKVLEFNELLCASDTLEFVVVVEANATANFNSTVSNLSDVSFTNTSTDAVGYTWDFGDGTPSTEANPTHTYSSNGTYNVQLVSTHANGCTDTITKTITIDLLGLAVNTMNASIQLYPNPVDEVLFINNSKMENLTIQVVDINGRLIYNTNKYMNDAMIEIPTQKWNKGMYFLTLTSENGLQATLKLIRK